MTDNDIPYRLVWSEAKEALKPLENEYGAPEEDQGGLGRLWEADPGRFTATVSLERRDGNEWEYVDAETAGGSDPEDPEPYDQAEARLLKRNRLDKTDLCDTIQPW